jgi:hypothetical protein
MGVFVNVCRNPDRSDYIWCYAKQGKSIRREKCTPLGSETKFLEDYYFGPHLGLARTYKDVMKRGVGPNS